MIDLFFVDTNVLVYRRDQRAGTRHKKADRWMKRLWQDASGRLSIQVLEEFYTVVTRKLSPGMKPEAARAEVRDFFAWQPLPLTDQLMESAFQLENKHRLSFWDSMIAAAAAASGCSYLLSEDLQDGQSLAGVKVVNPFKHDADVFAR